MYFHVYNKFDSMDLVVVLAKSEGEAINIAINDGYLTSHLGVQVNNIAALPFSSSDQVSDRIRRITSDGHVAGTGSK